jgi:hypothetical protein
MEPPEVSATAEKCPDLQALRMRHVTMSFAESDQISIVGSK